MCISRRSVAVRWFLPGLLISALLFPPASVGRLFSPSPAFAQSISELSRWEANMKTYGSLHCILGSLGHTYYDGERVYYQIAEYTRDPSWITCAQLVESVYRDEFVLPNNGGVPGFWNFTHGLTMDYLKSGDTLSQDAVIMLSQNAAFAGDATPLEWTRTAERSREVAYAIISYINSEKVGAAPRSRLPQLVDQALGHIDQWFISKTYRCSSTCDPVEAAGQYYIQPFMVGLTSAALIMYYEKTGDTRVLPAVRAAVDWLWPYAWVPLDESFWYDNWVSDPSEPFPLKPGAPDLNLLVAPAYAWVYRQTGETKYRDQGDAIFAGGVRRAYLGTGKHFNQNYWWSFDYVKWRSAPADTSPPTVSVTEPSNGSTVSGSAVTVSVNASDNVGVAGVQFKLDGANLGVEDTASPYSVVWNTATAANGPHTLTAVARDAAGNRTASPAISVTVDNSTASSTPPVISSVAVSSITSSGATITWMTNELADSQVEYGVTMSYGGATPLDPSMVATHTVSLSGLQAGTLHHYRVKSKNGSGHQAISGDFTFTTAPSSTVQDPDQDSGSSEGTAATDPDPAQGSGAPTGGAATGPGPSQGSGALAGGTATAPAPAQGSGASAGGAVITPAPTQGSGVPAGQAATVPAPAQGVVWTRLINVTATGNSLKKTSGCNGCADAGAISRQQIAAAEGYLQFTASETGTLRFVGLGRPDPRNSRKEIHFAIGLRPGGIAEIRESGRYRARTRYVRGDVFRIAIEAGKVRYYKNGRLLYTSSVAPMYPLLVATSLWTRGATVTNAVVSGKLFRRTVPPAGTTRSKAPAASPVGSQGSKDFRRIRQSA